MGTTSVKLPKRLESKAISKLNDAKFKEIL
jgi:hypothetical protein